MLVSRTPQTWQNMNKGPRLFRSVKNMGLEEAFSNLGIDADWLDGFKQSGERYDEIRHMWRRLVRAAARQSRCPVYHCMMFHRMRSPTATGAEAPPGQAARRSGREGAERAHGGLHTRHGLL